MKKIIVIFLLLFLYNCSNSVNLETDTVYSLEDIESIGIKVRGDFDTFFPESIESKWAFYKGREVAVLIYPSAEKANINGEISALNQTNIIEVVEKNIAHGPKVEKTKCRGHGDTGGWTGRGGIKLRHREELNFGIENTLLLNKLKIFNDNELQILNSRSCPRREPLYTEYIIIGNTVLMAEPLRDSSDVTIKFLEDLAIKLIEKD